MALTQSFQKLNNGDKAPDFSLQGTDGKTYSLADFKDKESLLIVFMCNHCPYVKAKIGAIVQLHEKYKDKVAVVGINSNDPGYEGEGMENMKGFARERNIGFPYLFDDTQKVARAYGATCTPDPFLFDKEQKLVFHGRKKSAEHSNPPWGAPSSGLSNEARVGFRRSPPFDFTQGDFLV